MKSRRRCWISASVTFLFVWCLKFLSTVPITTSHCCQDTTSPTHSSAMGLEPANMRNWRPEQPPAATSTSRARALAPAPSALITIPGGRRKRPEPLEAREAEPWIPSLRNQGTGSFSSSTRPPPPLSLSLSAGCPTLNFSAHALPKMENRAGRGNGSDRGWVVAVVETTGTWAQLRPRLGPRTARALRAPRQTCGWVGARTTTTRATKTTTTKTLSKKQEAFLGSPRRSFIQNEPYLPLQSNYKAPPSGLIILLLQVLHRGLRLRTPCPRRQGERKSKVASASLARLL